MATSVRDIGIQPDGRQLRFQLGPYRRTREQLQACDVVAEGTRDERAHESARGRGGEHVFLGATA